MSKLNEHQEADLETCQSEIQRIIDSEQGIQLTLAVDIVCGVVANVQLALRHPANTGDAAACGRAFCEVMIDQLEQLSPRLARIMRKGYLPAEDA